MDSKTEVGSKPASGSILGGLALAAILADTSPSFKHAHKDAILEAQELLLSDCPDLSFKNSGGKVDGLRRVVVSQFKILLDGDGEEDKELDEALRKLDNYTPA
jgi:hypothetical protein